MLGKNLVGLAVVALIAGCGGGDKSKDTADKAPSANAASAAAEAKANARNATSVVESCFIDTQDYSQCEGAEILEQAGLETGTGPGQVTVSEATKSSYRIEAYSEGGGTFAVVKAGNGAAPKRTCSGPAGCEGGSW